MDALVSKQCLIWGFQELCKELFFKMCQGKPEGPAKSGSDLAKSQAYCPPSLPPPGHSLEVKWIWMSLNLYLCSLKADFIMVSFPKQLEGPPHCGRFPSCQGALVCRNSCHSPWATPTFSITFVPTGNSRLFWRPS